jgi:integrase
MARQSREIPWLETRQGVFYVNWYDKATKRTHRYSLRTADPQQAQAGFVAFLTDGKAMYEKSGPDLTVRQALDFYDREHVQHEVVAKRRAAAAILHLNEHLGDMELRQIDASQCRVYAKKRQATITDRRRPTSMATIRRELGVLQAAGNYAKKSKRIGHQDMPSVELPDVAASKVGSLTRKELVEVLAKAEDNQDVWDFIMLLYYTGSRRRVIEFLESYQVDFESSVMTQMKAGEKITKKRRPPIPIDREILPILRRRFADGRKYLFGKNMYTQYVAHLKACGFGEGKMNPHVMRHTRATILLADGVSIYKVAKRLGDTVATVEKTYAHVIVSDLADLGHAL